MSIIVNLPPELEHLVQQQVASGAFRDADEVVRAALVCWNSDAIPEGWTVDELRAAIDEGRNSGPGIPLEQVMAEFQTRRDY
jgi:antitoxin ParD1/3/4